MATYKVLQDIEAEDKLLGPLTLKQFIFAIITIVIGFIEFKLATTTALSIIRWPFVIVLLLPMAVFGFLAAPISRDQPNDIWLLARLRFLIKPHTRIWNQDGISQLVTINVPKKIQRVFTNGLDQTEVKSRLSALASTLDSRGWATKNVDVNMFAQPGYLGSTDDGSDRLVAPSNLPLNQATVDIKAADDILDADNNPTAHHLDEMVQASTAAHRQQVKQSFQAPQAVSQATPADYWFLNQPTAGPAAPPPGLTTFQNSQVVAPGSNAISATTQPTADERALISKIEAEQAQPQLYKSHLKTIQPLGAVAPQPPVQTVAPQPVQSVPAPSILPPVQNTPIPQTTTPNPAILSLANNDDLNVATIARQARHISESDEEVVISLR
jgi:hypothetical protein